MHRITLIFLISLLAVGAAAQTRRPAPTPKPTQGPPQTSGSLPSITRVRLDKNQITIPCPGGYKPMDGDEACPSDAEALKIKVEISTSAAVPADTKYEYSVTGGMINGTGRTVEWDVSGLDPGSYRLTATLISGKSRSTSKSLVVSLSQCRSCAGQCECPEIKVSGPPTAKAGEVVTFTAEVSGSSQDQVTYNWTISDGDILQGQGTPTIEVQTYSQMAGKKLMATVIIGGLNPTCNCNKEKSFETGELQGSGNRR